MDIRAWYAHGDLTRVAAAAFGAWFVANGVLAAFTLTFGIAFPVAGDWAHGGVHFATGVAGLAAARSGRHTRAYLAALAVLYVAATATGAVAGDTMLGIAEVDTFGTVVHGIEAALALALAAVTPVRTPAARPG